jgi:hypothetical protein
MAQEICKQTPQRHGPPPWLGPLLVGCGVLLVLALAHYLSPTISAGLAAVIALIAIVRLIDLAGRKR